MGDVAKALDDEHAHRVDIKIDGPGKAVHAIEVEVFDVDEAVEGAVDADVGRSR